MITLCNSLLHCLTFSQFTEEDKLPDVNAAAAMGDRTKGVTGLCRSHNHFVVDLKLSVEHACQVVLPIILTKGSQVHASYEGLC